MCDNVLYAATMGHVTCVWGDIRVLKGLTLACCNASRGRKTHPKIPQTRSVLHFRYQNSCSNRCLELKLVVFYKPDRKSDTGLDNPKGQNIFIVILLFSRWCCKKYRANTTKLQGQKSQHSLKRNFKVTMTAWLGRCEWAPHWKGSISSAVFWKIKQNI